MTIMKKKVNVFIFANDVMKQKAIRYIDNIPCLLRIINSFKELDYDYDFNFIVICYIDEIELIEDEMKRWIDGIEFIPIDTRQKSSLVFYNYIVSPQYKTFDLVFITALYFPLMDCSMIRQFLKYFKNNPVIMSGNFEKTKLLHWDKFFPSFTKKNNKCSFQGDGQMTKDKCLLNCVMDEIHFKQLYSLKMQPDMEYYKCYFWDIYSLPKYFFKYEAIPFVKENDIAYIESFCIRKQRMEMSLHLQRLWSRWQSIEERLKKMNIIID